MTTEIMGLLERIRGLELNNMHLNQQASKNTKEITRLKNEINDILDFTFMENNKK